MSEISLTESTRIVRDQFIRVLWRNRRKDQHIDKVGCALMDLILNAESMRESIPTPMQLCDYLIKQGMPQKQAIEKSRIYYEQICKPEEEIARKNEKQ